MISTDQQRRIDRRQVLKSVAIGGGITVLTGVAESLNGVGAAQIELGTPVAVTPEAEVTTPAAQFGPTVASKAAELGYDQERIFRFVADEIRYEAYTGALRGANGTLWSLAGNSVDKALLMAALLDEALIEYRFAIGPLDDAGIEQLTAAMTTNAQALAENFNNAQLNGLSPAPIGLPSEPALPPSVDVTVEQQRQIDEITANATSAIDLAAELTELHLGIITEALSSAGIELPALPDLTPPDTEINRHVWLQLADGPVWIDYAPALNGAESGRAPTSTITETVPEIPVDLIHTVILRIIAEEFIGGSNVRRDAISLQFASADLVNVPVSFIVMPPSSYSDLGLSMNELFTGQATFVPVMLARDTAYTADVPIVFGASGGVTDVLAAEGEDEHVLGDGETLALWLAVDITSPGAEPITIERSLFDRVGFAGRQNETIDFAAIDPVTLVDDPAGGSVVAGLIAAWLISVDSARLPFSYALGDTESTNTYGALALASPGLPSLRDGLRLTGEIPRGIHSFISSPQVTLVSAAKTQPDDLESGVTIEFDLVHHSPAVHRLPGGAGAAEVVHPLLLAGVMDQIAEQVMLESAAMNGGDTGGVVFGANLGRVFAAAMNEGIEIRTLTESADLSEIGLGTEATARITTALDAGLIVIVPERSVVIDDVDRSGWWLIDPATGRTWDELDTGKGSASLSIQGGSGVRFDIPGYGLLLRIVTTVAQFFRTFGFAIVCGVAGAIVLLGLAASGVGTAGGATSERNPAYFYGLAAGALASAAAAGGIAGPACL